jgi:hypothetical protein
MGVPSGGAGGGLGLGEGGGVGGGENVAGVGGGDEHVYEMLESMRWISGWHPPAFSPEVIM